MDHFRDGELIHGYVVNPEPRGIDHFQEIIRHSYTAAATFMNVIVIERFFQDHAVRFHNLTLTESTRKGATTSQLSSRNELAEAIVHHCGFPSEFVREVVSEIALEADIYS